jgi:large subunit ribosomal protein L19
MINVISPVNVENRKKADIRTGDTIRVWLKVKEGKKVRLQAFEGIVIARKHGSEAGATFTVRKTASGVGVERIFPLYSPVIDKIEVVKRSKVRRSKLYYIREKASREIKRKMRQERSFEIKTIGGEKEEVENEEKLTKPNEQSEGVSGEEKMEIKSKETKEEKTEEAS